MAKMKNMVMIATILPPFAAGAPCAFTVEAIALKKDRFSYICYFGFKDFKPAIWLLRVQS